MLFKIQSKQREELIDITEHVNKAVAESGVREGLCHVFVTHATAAIAVIENYDPNVCVDFLSYLSMSIPQGKWLHDKVDGNADAHIKATIIGPSEMLPVANGKLVLGTWQNLVLCCFDGPRERKILVTVQKND